MKFRDKLNKIIEKNESLVCVGLDIDSQKIPTHLFKLSSNPYLDFNKAIIDATQDLVCAYKLNLAFYEQFGLSGMKIFNDTLEYFPKDVIIILDGKRNDIGNTAKKYAISLFEHYHADAITINPYLGVDGVAPFLRYEDKYNFILCRTSNQSASDFQDLIVDDKPLYEHVAHKIVEWNEHNNCGAVVGATYPEELKKIRLILGEDAVLLIPGVGKQGGNLEKTVLYGTNKLGAGALINSSRGILYADNSEMFAEKAREKTLEMQESINTFRKRKVH